MDLGTPQRIIHNDSGIQIIQETVTPAGDTIAKRVGFDFNPVQLDGDSPHLNLQTQKNGDIIRNGPYADPHVNVDPNTIKKEDY